MKDYRTQKPFITERKALVRGKVKHCFKIKPGRLVVVGIAIAMGLSLHFESEQAIAQQNIQALSAQSHA